MATAESGVVRVSIHTRRPASDVWSALAEPHSLGRWFGELDQPWQEGRSGRIEFGDGDFFEVTTNEIVERRLIDFEWRFLGLGPLSRIRWTITDFDGQTKVTVEDGDPTRTKAEADQLVEGWVDFFQRLGSYLETGQSTRYEWRDEIDGSVDLPAGSSDPFEAETLLRWLPVASDGFKPSWFFVVDEEGPRRFPITDWNLGAEKLTFAVEVADGAPSTFCTVTVEPVGAGTGARRLRFEHTNWRGLGIPNRKALLLRRRFIMSWITALEHARQHASAQ